MKKYPFEEKTVEELVKLMDEASKRPVRELTEEEEIEEDAEYGYFQERDENEEYEDD